MQDYDLYINLTSNYTDDSDYFIVDVENTISVDEGMIDNMPVYRKAWNEIIVKNRPYQYKNTLESKYKLYDLILEESPDTTFYVKFVHGDNTIYGYFGQVDCRVNEDRSLINIKPAVIDQYTDFIENYDEKIDIFGEKNVIKNGEFNVWTNDVPDGWTVDKGSAKRDTFLQKTCVRLYPNELFNQQGSPYIDPSLVDTIHQTINGVQKDKQVIFKFLYRLVGVTTDRTNLSFEAYIESAGKYYNLNLDGSWTESASIILTSYKTNARAFSKSEIESANGTFDTIEILSDASPVSGNFTIRFTNDTSLFDYIYITGIEVVLSNVAYIELKLDLFNASLISKPQEEIINVNTGRGALFAVRVKQKTWDKYVLEDYFDEDGKPSNLVLSGPLAPNDGTNHYQTWIDIFENDIGSSFYKGEISELTVLRGVGFTTNLRQYRYMAGYAIFTRDEAYKTDEYDEEDNLIPPVGDGWVSLDEKDTSSRRLWVRKPFNGAYSGANATWKLGTKLQKTGKFMYFDYHTKLTSTKVYPVNESSRSVEAAIDFRDICRKIYRSTHNSLLDKEVYSAFFWNDSPYIDDLRIVNNANYVTRQDNKLNNIAAVHTSLLKTEVDQRSQDQKLEISFKDFFEDLRVKFPDLIWFVDANKNLHIEHMKYIDLTEDFLNILTNDYLYVGDYASYEFDPEQIYGNYEFSEINSGFQDFAESKITFDKIVTNKRNKDMRKEVESKILSSDIQYAIENPNGLENGIILVAYDTVDDENIVRYGRGQITKTNVMNGDLALSTLLSTYSKYEGVWRHGYINGELSYFPYTKKVKRGDAIRLKGIIADNFLLTSLGIATAISKKYDYANETTEITPVYRHYDYFLVMSENNLVAI
jgi:hypothetical protein